MMCSADDDVAASCGFCGCGLWDVECLVKEVEV